MLARLPAPGRLIHLSVRSAAESRPSRRSLSLLTQFGIQFPGLYFRRTYRQAHRDSSLVLHKWREACINLQSVHVMVRFSPDSKRGDCPWHSHHPVHCPPVGFLASTTSQKLLSRLCWYESSSDTLRTGLQSEAVNRIPIAAKMAALTAPILVAASLRWQSFFSTLPAASLILLLFLFSSHYLNVHYDDDYRIPRLLP